MKLLGIILARGGSKRLLGKNIKKLNGKPLISYSIELLKQSPLIDRVIVSTDDDEIAKVAKDYDALVPFMRPKDLSEDSSTSEVALAHAFKKCEELWGKRYDGVVLAQPTSPFTSDDTLVKAVEKFSTGDYDTVITICNVHTKLEWIGFIANDSMFEKLVNVDIPNVKQMSPSGNLYVIGRENVIAGKIYNGKIGAVEVDLEEAVDIDYQIDFDFAEFIINKRR